MRPCKPRWHAFDRFSALNKITTVIILCAGSAWLMGHASSGFSLGLAQASHGRCVAFAFVAVLTGGIQMVFISYYAALVGLTQLLAALGAGFGTAPLWVPSKSRLAYSL